MYIGSLAEGLKQKVALSLAGLVYFVLISFQDLFD